MFKNTTRCTRRLHKPVIIIGAPRSGTTLMGKILSQHQDVLYLEEPRLTWRYGNDRKSDQLRPEDARPEVIDYIHRAFGKQVHQAGRARLLEKTPSNSLRLGYVDRVMPDCKVIHMIRDGVAGTLAIRDFWDNHANGVRGIAPGRITQRLKEVKLSRLPYYGSEVIRRVMPDPLRGLAGRNLWGPRVPGMRGMLNEMPLLEVCAHQWRACVERACIYGRTMPTDRYREFRLERFSLDHIRSIMDFCELQPSKAVTEQAEKLFNKDQPAKRLAEADENDLADIRRWVAPTMRWLESEVHAEPQRAAPVSPKFKEDKRTQDRLLVPAV